MSPERYPYNQNPPGDYPRMDRRRIDEEVLCWRCDAVMTFYQPKCRKCGATNPNTDLERAQEEMRAMFPDLYPDK